MLALLIYTAVKGRNREQKINCILQVLFMAAQKQRMARTAGKPGTRGAAEDKAHNVPKDNMHTIHV